MKKYLKILSQILVHGYQGTVSTSNGLLTRFLMNDKAAEMEIAHCDTILEKRLPGEYKEFLRIYNGGILFKIEDIGGFKFFGTRELISENKFQRQNFGSYWNAKITLFCGSIGDGEYFGFKFGENTDYEIVYCIMDELPETWISIGNSFEIFIDRLIEEEGEKFWL